MIFLNILIDMIKNYARLGIGGKYFLTVIKVFDA